MFLYTMIASVVMEAAMIEKGEAKAVVSLLQEIREQLDRLEAILVPTERDEFDELDPGSRLNKSDQFLTKRGIEVCYRMFDAGKTRYAVKQAMNISYGAATHRFHAWEKLGGKNRERQPLD
jgi:hypothetical protein